MANILIPQAKAIFDFATLAGLTDEDQSNFTDRLDLESYKAELASDKEKFLNTNKDIESPEVIWEQGIDAKVSDELSWKLVNLAIEDNKGIMVDWKSSAEDIAFNVQKLNTGLKIESESEEQIEGKFMEKIIIDEKEHLFDSESESLVFDVISVINEHLSDTGKQLIYYTEGADDMYFILVKEKALTEINRYKFATIE